MCVCLGVSVKICWFHFTVLLDCSIFCFVIVNEDNNCSKLAAHASDLSHYKLKCSAAPVYVCMFCEFFFSTFSTIADNARFYV